MPRDSTVVEVAATVHKDFCDPPQIRPDLGTENTMADGPA